MSTASKTVATMTNRDRSNIGDEALALANLAITRLGWIFRPQPANDNGIDAEIEITPVSQHGRLLKAQVKGGPSYFSKSGKPVLYGRVVELVRWQTLGIPVVIITCDLKLETCYWQVASDTTVDQTVRGWKIDIPATNVLNISAIESLKQVAARSDAYLTVAKVVAISSPSFSVPGWAHGHALEIRSGTVSDVEPVERKASSGELKPIKVAENVSISYPQFSGRRSRDVFTLFDENFGTKLNDELSLILAPNEDESRLFSIGVYNWTLRRQSEFVARVWPTLNPAQHKKQHVVSVAVTVTTVVTGFVVMLATHQQFFGVASGVLTFVILLILSLRIFKTTDRLKMPLAERRVQEILEELRLSSSETYSSDYLNDDA